MARFFFRLIGFLFLIAVLFFIGLAIYTLFFDPAAKTEAVQQNIELSG